MKDSLSYILNHLGEERSKYFNAVSPPIIQTSNFVFDSFDQFRNAIANEDRSHIYTRGNNPTVQILRKKVAALEKTEDALAFASGSGAIAAAVMTFIRSGDHVVCVDNPYSWTKTLFNMVLPKFGVSVTYVDGRSLSNIESAIRPQTKILYLESPNTATFALQDLNECAKLAKKHEIMTMIDNSYCSPIYQNPSDYGIDLVLHSGTKYLNGHSDVVCGFVCGSHAHVKQIFQFATMTMGNILGPAEAALVLRGLRTLDLRVHRSHMTTLEVVAYLKSHPAVDSVLYPWDESFAQFELAKQQMKGAGGLFSIILDTDNREKIEQFCEALNTFLFAVSWGGHESLILPFCSLLDIPGHPDPEVPVNLIRFYIGLEDADYLIQDLKQAFEATFPSLS
ncbi:aminotransferase class I/II-fold pyridoxal phosphate-dependent enzyme [Portibacter marinus]|uniref:aminotransferase class I/II-fold pyridoxal phosphate-dependent enzyme n=1 Tax=Portibacter marinus TaxID=2898660 RepID=UPI001F314818|nr:aminotransferase class I/II-fold pyridoxal phosphate-dependent enzyme [Portibacter marinus]